MFLANDRRITYLVAYTEQFHECARGIFAHRLIGPFPALDVQFINMFQLVCARIWLAFTIEEPATICVNFTIIDIIHRVHKPQVAKVHIYSVFLH